MPEESPKGKMTVEEAGRKGGQKERKLVEEGRKTEEKGERSRK
jgi:general stress protein YciG